jgi:hypothetical protein
VLGFRDQVSGPLVAVASPEGGDGSCALTGAANERGTTARSDARRVATRAAHARRVVELVSFIEVLPVGRRR